LPKLIPLYFPKITIRRECLNEMVPYSLGNYVAEAIGAAPTFLMPLIIVNSLGEEASAYFR